MTLEEALEILGPIRCVAVEHGLFNLYGSRYIKFNGDCRYVTAQDVIEAAMKLEVR